MDSTLFVDVLAGVTGGFASALVGQPLDTVKGKMQLFPQMYGGMTSCLSNIIRQQGFRGLYAGIIPALASNGADEAVMFGTYGQCQKIVAKSVGVLNTTDLNYIENAAAGSIASFSSALVLCPTELVKIRMQGINYDVKCESADQVFKKIWKFEGFKGLYRGLGCTIVREFIGCSVFFGAYERAREELKPVGKRKEDCSAVATMVAGSLAGICTSSVVYPIDAIKSRVQMEVKDSEFQVIQKVLSIRDGSRGLYSGLLPTMVKTIPVTGVLLLTVEFSKPFYRKCLSEIPSFQSNISHENVFSVCDYLSGWIAGIVSTLIGHPIDTVKVVQQVTNSTVKTTVRDIYHQDKFKGYFRGMMFPILSVGVANSVFFGTYGNVLRLIQIQRDGNQTNKYIDVRFCSDAENLHKYWHLDVFLSGCIAGLPYAFINTPIEVIKTLLQARNVSLKQDNVEIPKRSDPLKTTSAFKLMGELYKVNGVRSLYRGGTLLFIRDVPSMGIYMLSYEHLCSMLTKLPCSETKNDSMPKYVQIVSGGVAGVLSWVLVLPFDVIKSKIITDSLVQPLYKGAWDCAKKTYIKGGAMSFLRGFRLLCIRAFPVNGIAFATYETIISGCNKRTDQLKNTAVESKWM